MKVKSIICAICAVFSVFAIADDSPLVQAMKTRDKIEEIREAIARRGIECESFDEMPQAIGQISFINEFFDDEYAGPIVLNKNFTKTSFQYINGKFDLTLLANTTIAQHQFENSYGLKNIYLPNVTTIKDYAFQNSYINSIEATNCSSIAAYAFDNCVYLNGDIIMPKLATIGIFSFRNAPKITSIKSLPFSNVPTGAFSGCTSLTNVNIDTTTCTFNENCFENCTSLQHIPVPNTFYLNANCFNGSGMTNATEFLQKMTTTGAEAISCFKNCANLKEVKSDSLVKINTVSLFENSGIETVDFPCLTTLYSDAVSGNYYYYANTFNNCYNLKHINMPALKTINTIPYGSYNGYILFGIFSNCTSLEDVEFPALETIGTAERASVGSFFKNCYRLKSASFPSLTFMETYGHGRDDSAFSYCYALTNVHMPALRRLALFSYSCFLYSCTSIEKLSFPNLNELYYYNNGNNYASLAAKCTKLRCIEMPAVTNIYNVVALGAAHPVLPAPGVQTAASKNLIGLFVQCYLLTDITTGIKAKELKAYSNFPGGVPDTCVFHCPADAPYDVDIVKRNGTWEIVTNGTYQLADYISGNGKQYINTGYIHGTNTQVEIEFSLTPQSNYIAYEYMFGYRNGSNTKNSYGLYSVFQNQPKFTYVRNVNTVGSAYALDQETQFKVVCQGQICSIYNQNGELLQRITSTAEPNEGIGPLCIFNCNESTAAGGFSPYSGGSGTSAYGGASNMKLYKFTIKEGDQTVLELLPAVRNDGVPCLVDKKNNWHPLFNCGTGDFTYGSITNSVQLAN